MAPWNEGRSGGAASTDDVAWEAKVVDADGRRHEVRLDATGRVLDVRADD